MTIRVLLVEDHPMYRAGLAASLALDEAIEVVAAVDSAAAALALAAEGAPDVVILDIGLPDAEGTTVIARLREVSPGSRVLMLTSYDDDSHIYRALREGARGYVVKSADADEICRAVHSVAAGEGHFSAGVVERINEHVATGGRSSDPAPFPGLTRREREILQLMAQGRSNTFIADHFVLSLKTVRNHVSNVMGKLGVGTRAEAIVVARGGGLG